VTASFPSGIDEFAEATVGEQLRADAIAGFIGRRGPPREPAHGTIIASGLAMSSEAPIDAGQIFVRREQRLMGSRGMMLGLVGSGLVGILRRSTGSASIMH